MMYFCQNGVMYDIANFDEYASKFDSLVKSQYKGEAESYLFAAIEANDMKECQTLTVELVKGETETYYPTYFEFECNKEGTEYCLCFISCYSMDEESGHGKGI